MKKTSVLISVVALAVSLFCLYLVIVGKIGNDSSNLIATLGVLCTVLIGWQIFSFIDLRSYEKRMGELESRLLEDEKRLAQAQQGIINSLEKNASAYKSIEGTYRSLLRGDGALSNGIAYIFRYLRDLDTHTPSDFLCNEISWHLYDFDIMLPIFSSGQLKDIIKSIREALNCGITLSPIHAKTLMEQMNAIAETFNKSSDSTNQEKREVLNEAISLILSISA